MLQNSIARLRNRKEPDDGFTLVELAIVVLIIAILLAIAIPTFLGARESAQNRAAQSNVRNALTAANVIYSDQGEYPAVATLIGDLDDAEPSLEFFAGPVPTDDDSPDRQISVATAALSSTGGLSGNASVEATGSSQVVVLSARSDNNTCWRVREAKAGSSPGTTYQTSGVASGNTCTSAVSMSSGWEADW